MEKEQRNPKYQGLQVIGAGLPRTGTSSLREALEVLGFKPCHHFKTLVDEPWPYPESQKWIQVFGLLDDRPRRQKVLREIFETNECLAAIDYPTAGFVEDLMEMYPDAKIVHTTRSSPQTWSRSFNETIRPLCTWPYHILLFWVPKHVFSIKPVQRGFVQKCFLDTGFDMCDQNNEQVFLKHNEKVRQIVPKERALLDFEASMGWEPLCSVLGVEVPRDGETGEVLPYPRLNDTQSFRKVQRVVKIVGPVSWGVVLGVGWCCWRYVVAPMVERLQEM